MIDRLRATRRDGAGAIATALGRENIANLAEKLGYTRNHQVARLKEIATGGIEPTTEELVQLCAVISEGILRYDEQADAVVTDALNALRGALFGRTLSQLQEGCSGIPMFKLESFRDGADCLLKEQLDELVLHLFPGAKIDHETGTLVSRGYVQHPESAYKMNSNPHARIFNPDAPPRFDPSLKSNEVPVSIGVFAPVAEGSERVDSRYALLTVESPGEARKRMLAKEQTIPYMR